jgi:ABC-type transport system involved in multi-copper enzyme maturation permease subunit
MSQFTEAIGGPKSGSNSRTRRWLIRPDVAIIFLLLITPFGLAAATELGVFAMLGTPGYIILFGFAAITSPILPAGFLGTPGFYVLSGIWFYLIAALLAAILRSLWRLLPT